MNYNSSDYITPKLIKEQYFSGKEGKPTLHLAAIYNFFKRKDFPKIQIGRKLLVRRELFIEWLDKEARKTG